MKKRVVKKRKSPRKRAVTEKEIRDMIAKHERLLESWLKKLGAATTQVKKNSRKIAYYNKRLEVLSERRESKGLRSIDTHELD